MASDKARKLSGMRWMSQFVVRHQERNAPEDHTARLQMKVALH